MSAWDSALVGREVVRALRGSRSQVQLARRLGYRSNVVYRWEAGLRAPSAGEVFRLAARVGVDVAAWLDAFEPLFAEEARPHGAIGTPEHLRAWLRALRRGHTLAEVADRTGLSVPAAQRVFAGRAQLPFATLLTLVDGLEDRVVDFVGGLVPLDAVPSLGRRRLAVTAMREQSFRLRWTEAVLAALEVHGDDPEPQAPSIAARLSRDEAEVRAILDALVLTGGLQRRADRWVVPRNRRVDTTVDRARHLDQGRFWAETALAYDPPQAARGYLVMSCSDDDLSSLFELHRSMHAQTVELVAPSPSQRVVLVVVQTVALDGQPLPGLGRS